MIDKETIGILVLGVGAILLFLDAIQLGLDIPMDIVTAGVIPLGLFMIGA